MPTIIPTLDTERLVLRGHRPGDFDAHALMWSDPDVTRFIGGTPFPRDQAWVRFLRAAGMWQVMGFGFWAVEEKSSGELLGEVGFHELQRDLQPSLEGTLEAGWALRPAAHGKGFATEAVGAALAWGVENFPDKRVTCMIDPENTASLRVAQKLGFREFARTEFHGGPIILLER
ncbi:N-acetyltransferase [Mesorhizobium sp. L-8-10]|uniref:GNAT family N-acetyltransferase n=1 Tax=Mesorhizobium sp. L-8-10 TaxID=2744523 RepID=UPI001927D72C|nr:GNAT family N-acetyltransferase [Mesorhizobium sp. L-8-10]BCH28147.1 N-acetyltransferase [Mesorhizobium sp. L-8-10]